MGLKYKIEFVPDGTVVRLTGNIDEQAAAPLSEIRKQVVGKAVLFDCEQVGIINSIGAATWLSAIHAFAGLSLIFVNCPHTFTSLCLMITDFTMGGVVDSLYVRYLCAGCARGPTKMVLVKRQEALAAGVFKPRQCPHCGQAMAADADDEELIEVFRGPEV